MTAWLYILFSYNVHLRETLPSSYRKCKSRDNISTTTQRFTHLTASPALKPRVFVLLQSFQSFPCLQNFSQLFFTTCCHLSNALSQGTLMMKVCNGGTLFFQRSDFSKTATMFYFYVIIHFYH